MSPRVLPSVRMTEAQWQRMVVDLATLHGWSHYHAYDSRRSNPGWPDLALWRPDQFILVELKTDTGRLRPEQALVIDDLREAGVEVHVWRPADWDTVKTRLARKGAAS